MTTRKSRVERTRGGGKYTEAGFFSFIRSGLRSKYQRWAPRYAALAAAKRSSENKDNPRLKWEFVCAICNQWHPQKNVEVDHIIPCGSLKRFSDLPGFVERLLCEQEDLRVVCKQCHLKITKGESLELFARRAD